VFAHWTNRHIQSEVDVGWVGAAEKLDDIALLRVVPLAQILDLHSIGFQSQLRPLDLDLQTTVGQKKRQLMVYEYFHC
jgi:hypothetical protein